ncbi:unnamed protein product [Schistosoma margrebowiei]|uniref:Uncharacterized protein n=1 Tax=Schistosoma margrebowiei TaxID=48269 RepID=A0A3P7Z4R3_9TREM|nr:unnamed protein product [Schistosoma margrebowiei]
MLINTCNILMMVVVVLEVPAPYSRTDLTFVLKIVTLILVDSCFELHMFFNCRNAVFALPILVLTSASDPPRSSMMLLTRYVKDSISSRASPSSEIVLIFSVLYLKMLAFSLCMLRPTDAEAVATLFFFTCICWCVWD